MFHVLLRMGQHPPLLLSVSNQYIAGLPHFLTAHGVDAIENGDINAGSDRLTAEVIQSPCRAAARNIKNADEFPADGVHFYSTLIIRRYSSKSSGEMDCIPRMGRIGRSRQNHGLAMERIDIGVPFQEHLIRSPHTFLDDELVKTIGDHEPIGTHAIPCRYDLSIQVYGDGPPCRVGRRNEI